jgi:hypothetical protein
MSNRLTLDKVDYKKIGKGALIAVGGCLLTYLTQEIGNIDFGQYQGLVVAAWSIIVNLGRKLLVK